MVNNRIEGTYTEGQGNAAAAATRTFVECTGEIDG
jgi:hypothetical protein